MNSVNSVSYITPIKSINNNINIIIRKLIDNVYMNSVINEEYKGFVMYHYNYFMYYKMYDNFIRVYYKSLMYSKNNEYNEDNLLKLLKHCNENEKFILCNILISLMIRHDKEIIMDYTLKNINYNIYVILSKFKYLNNESDTKRTVRILVITKNRNCKFEKTGIYLGKYTEYLLGQSYNNSVARLIGGHIKKDESNIEAVCNELYEETGIKFTKLDLISNVNVYYYRIDESGNLIKILNFNEIINKTDFCVIDLTNDNKRLYELYNNDLTEIDVSVVYKNKLTCDIYIDNYDSGTLSKRLPKNIYNNGSLDFRNDFNISNNEFYYDFDNKNFR